MGCGRATDRSESDFGLVWTLRELKNQKLQHHRTAIFHLYQTADSIASLAAGAQLKDD